MIAEELSMSKKLRPLQAGDFVAAVQHHLGTASRTIIVYKITTTVKPPFHLCDVTLKRGGNITVELTRAQWAQIEAKSRAMKARDSPRVQ